MARFHIRHEVQEPPNPSGWVLCFQFGTYLYDDRSSEDGYRFIWRRPNGSLMTRGQARLPSIAKAKKLMDKASADGWGEVMSATPLQVDIVRAIREAFDQLSFKYASADRPHYVDGCRVWVPWQEDPLEGQSGWTTAVKTALCKIGQQNFGFGVGCHGVPMANYGEWLWDISWCSENTQERMADLPLAAECEWKLSSAAIVEDFQKLLVAPAGVRLMIHEHWTDREEIPDPPAMANHLAQHVRAFGRTRPSDVYLLVALDGTEPGAEYHRMRYFRLNTDGTAIEWIKEKPFPFEDLEC